MQDEEVTGMPNTPSPTVRGRRLRYELRRLREEAGRTHADAARALEWHASKISRIETGQSRAHPGDVRDMLDAYGVADEATKDALVQLAREARRRGWWMRYSDMFTGTYLGLEAEASKVCTYEPQFIPGLLQTEDYAHAVIRAGQVRPDPDDVERRVAARMERREIFNRPVVPEIWAILDEPVIRRSVGGPDVMGEQLRHLIDISTRPNTSVTLQVLPLSVGAHLGMNGPFTLVDFPDPKDPPVVYLEMAPQGIFLEESDDIARYTLRFEHLVARAFGPDQSIDMITQAADQLTG